MSRFDFGEIEEELELIVPDIYRSFAAAVEHDSCDLAKHHIDHDPRPCLDVVSKPLEDGEQATSLQEPAEEVFVAFVTNLQAFEREQPADAALDLETPLVATKRATVLARRPLVVVLTGGCRRVLLLT